jgi:hypothetical protein
LNLTEEIGSFPERLKLAIGKGSARAFALQCGFSATVMHQYLAGKSEPTRLALIAIAHTADINLEWLMTGEGPMMKNRGSVMIDKDLYEGVVEAVEEYLQIRNLNISPAKKLETYRYLYELFEGTPGVDKEQMEKFLRFVA